MFFILFGVLVLFWIYKHQTQWKYIESIPGPISLPIVGNAIELGFSPATYLKTLLKWWETYDKKIFRAWLALEPYVIISEPKDVEVVLSNTEILQKGDAYRFLRPWLGNGLLTAHGSKWHKFRKLITPSFHFKILNGFLEVMNKNSNNLIELLNTKADAVEILDIQKIIHYSTLDIICETAMGTEINALTNNNIEIVDAIQDMCFVVQQRIFGVFTRNDYLFTFTSLYQKQKKALKFLEKFLMNIIEKRRIFIENNITKNENDADDQQLFTKEKQIFLDSLLTATVDGRPLTNMEIFEEVSTFMFEGHDTSSSGISFCTHLLSLHPEIQEKLYIEQISILGRDLYKINPTYQNIQDMKYLEIVLKETLRLYPSVPLIGRYLTRPFKLNGRYIPSYTNLVVFIFGLGYNEKYFKDPLKFNPERFNERNSNNPYEYVPFSAGPRNCIGQKFSMLEMKSVISNIIRNFIILPPNDSDMNNINDEYKITLASVLTLKSDNGIHIRLKKRIN